MSMSRATLRQRFADHLAAQLSGWGESPFPYGEFGREPATLAHLSFTVGLGRTVPYGGRQKLANGAAVSTTVQIAFSYQLRQNLDDKVNDTDTAEAALQTLIVAAMGVSTTDMSRPRIESIEQPQHLGEFVRHDVTLSVPHRLALTE